MGTTHKALTLIALATLCLAKTPDLDNLDDYSKTLSGFYERIYTTGRTRTAGEAGEPVILTPYIEGGKLEEARKVALVDPDLMMPDVESYAGYLTVDKNYNSNLWFWYFPVADQPVEDTPWILWLQGGPGASSLYGLFTEIGPYAVTEDMTLEEIEYSWGKNHSLLFIDNPVGTGFSFTDDDKGYATNQTTIGEQLYDALQQFLRIFPELRRAPLIIAGESYAGKHIPSLAIQIHWHKKSDDPPIRLEGLAIGNGFIDPITMQNYSTFVREVGLVDDKTADFMRSVEGEIVRSLSHGDTFKSFLYYNFLLDVLIRNSHLDNVYNFEDDDVGLDGLYTDFIQRGEVRRALHVGSTNFTSIGIVYNKLILDFMNSAKPWLEQLLENYRVMCYSGHLDIIVAYRLSVRTHQSLEYGAANNYSGSERKPWYHDEKLVGYYKTAGNFTEVMLRRAGHMVPADVPAPALGLISAFARGISLDTDTGPLAQPIPASTRRRKLPIHDQERIVPGRH